jgi:hypothetical protein
MRTDILFAGIAFSWTQEYASSYAAKLREMGHCVRLASQSNRFLIAYSHRQFSLNEMQEALTSLCQQKSEGNN